MNPKEDSQGGFRAILAEQRSGWTPLHVAVRNGDRAQVRALLAAGCDIDAMDSIGRTAVHVAAHTPGSALIAGDLIDRGANLNAAGLLRKGVTPLHVAALCGSADVASLLIGRGAKVNARDRHLLTPLHNAASEGHVQLVDLLLRGGGEVDARDEDGAAPLYFAAKQGHAEVVECLVRSGGHVDQKDNQGNTPLTVAVNANHLAVVRVLADNGADVNARGQSGRTPIFWTCSTEISALLLQKGADIGATDQWGNCALHILAEKGNSQVLEFLLANNADVNAANRKHRSPLHWAANAETVDVLLNSGADVNIKDIEGKTPRDLARHEGRTEVAKALSARTTGRA